MDNPVAYTLITGASSGIGRSIAVTLAASRKLIIHGRDRRRLEETRQQCQRPEDHILWEYDLQNAAGLSSSLTAFLKTNNLVVAEMVHCAGILKISPARLLEFNVVMEQFNVNILSAIEIIGVLARKKCNQDALRNILFISSIISEFGAPGYSAYSATKGALDGFMKSLAVELAPKVRVNSILPGAILTPMTKGLLENDKKAAENYPLGLGRPGNIAAAVEFLMSDKAAWITGQQLIVDGGRTANISD